MNYVAAGVALASIAVASHFVSVDSPRVKAMTFHDDEADARDRKFVLNEAAGPPLTLDARTLTCIPSRSTFIECVTNMIEAENSVIMYDRWKYWKIRDASTAGMIIGDDHERWIDEKLARYQTKSLIELDRRMNLVPVKMAVAMAAVESGWGTSYAARVGNALFGQIQSTGKHDVKVPWNPGHDMPQPFASYRDSVNAFILNLNVHPAYDKMRRNRENTLDSYTLMGFMERYSERGHAYIKYVRGVMKDIDNVKAKQPGT